MAALRASRHMIDHRSSHVGLGDAAWELRGSITFYDSLYAAVAVSPDVPLLTADARLTRVLRLPCEVEVVV